MPETARDMTPAERAALAKDLAMIRSLGGLQADVPAYLFGAVILGLVILGAFLLTLKVLGIPTAGPIPLSGGAVIALGVLALSGHSLRRRHRTRRDRITRLEQDLTTGGVLQDDLTITEAKGFVEPEHAMRLYFLRATDGRVFTLYDYDSANPGGDRSRPTKLRFARQMTVLRFPVSGAVNYDFTGTPLRKPRVRALTVKPAAWPAPEAFCDIPWDMLETRLAG